MTAETARRKWLRPPAGRATAVRLLVSLGVVVAGAASAPPAQADPIQDAFLNALSNAGVQYNDPSTAVSLGQSICPMLAQPGGNFATVASNIAGQNGLSADMAGLFTSIAISMYCPSMMTSLANGDYANAFQIPGL
ncbi:MAG: DUF732 domain-containing protein [Mycobacteriaceae bacterium]|nr:DUF732 domain-containing protein [Mycobacteriaceae bacterium]